MRRLLAARHGESELSAKALVNGDPGVACPLTGLGRTQARALGAALADERIDLCVVTEFERVRETAEIALAGRDLPFLVLPELNDPRYGEFEGGSIVAYREWAWSRGPLDAPVGGEHRGEIVRPLRPRPAHACRSARGHDSRRRSLAAAGLSSRRGRRHGPAEPNGHGRLRDRCSGSRQRRSSRPSTCSRPGPRHPPSRAH